MDTRPEVRDVPDNFQAFKLPNYTRYWLVTCLLWLWLQTSIVISFIVCYFPTVKRTGSQFLVCILICRISRKHHKNYHDIFKESVITTWYRICCECSCEFDACALCRGREFANRLQNSHETWIRCEIRFATCCLNVWVKMSPAVCRALTWRMQLKTASSMYWT